MTRTLSAPRQHARLNDDYVALPPPPFKPLDTRPPRAFAPAEIGTIGNAIYRGMRPLRMIHESDLAGQALALECSTVVGELIVACRRLATDRPMAQRDVDAMRRTLQRSVGLLGGAAKAFCARLYRHDLPMLAAAERDMVVAIEIIISPPTLDTH